MNEQNQMPPGNSGGLPPDPLAPPLIPAAPSPWHPASAPPPGANAIEQSPISGIVGAVEAILRQPRRVMFQLKQPKPGALIGSLPLTTVACSLIYGIVVGTFSGGDQMWAAPVKIAIGLVISVLICLPSLYIFSCLGGSQARLVEVFGLVAGLMALMTVLLIGFAPVAWVFSQSTKSLAAMGSLHLGFWLVATIFGLRFLHAGFSHLSVNSNAGIRTWTVIFLLVALQMTTALRPIIGKGATFLPSIQDKKFFVTHWMDCLKDDPTVKSQALNGTYRD
jgi:hypothetical protein